MNKLSIIFFVLFLANCSSSDKDCGFLQSVNDNRTTSINKFYNEVENWPESNWRMRFLKPYVSNFKITFTHLKNSLKTPDIGKFQLSKNDILNNVSWFMKATTEDQVWINNDYFWIIQDTKDEIESFPFQNDKGCSEAQILEVLEFEERLVSTFYMMGFNDQYCFNKMEPTFNQVHFFGENDTTSISVGFYAYDSVQCYKLNYSLETSKYQIEDSTDCNWFFLPDGTGSTKIRGAVVYSLYGKKRTIEFDKEFYVK